MDTSPEAWKVYLETQRKLTPSQRLERVFTWSDAMRELSLAGMRQRYPHLSEREIFLRYTKASLGAELFQKVYGDALADGPSGNVS